MDRYRIWDMLYGMSEGSSGQVLVGCLDLCQA